KDIAPFINTEEYFTLGKTLQWYNAINESVEREDFVFIYNNKEVGMGGLVKISQKNMNCELYMYMDPSFQGKGLGFESCYNLCQYAFNSLSLKKIFLYTFSENIKANKLYEKIGFKLEGILRQHTYKDGSLRNRNIYGLLKNEFS